MTDRQIDIYYAGKKSDWQTAGQTDNKLIEYICY